MLFLWKNPGNNDSDVEKIKEVSLADSKLKEKDLENIISKRIYDLVRTDQLMVILQERSRQEEPDILALDEKGHLFIFELKRWEARSENLLQALRYGQKFGRYDYDRLNWFFQMYTHSQSRSLSLDEAHREYFDLQNAIGKDKFNTNQHFIIVTNGLDYDTWDAVAYWKAKGLNISSIIYRLFSVNDKLYVDFDPFGPIPDAPKEPESGIFVINTNKTYMPDAYKEMVQEEKGAAYYDRKRTVESIRAGNTVCLYHVGAGVIGIGKAKTEFLKKDFQGDVDEEFYIPIAFEYLVDINDPNWEDKAVHAWEINQHFNTSYRFRQTVFRLPYEFGNYIREKFIEKGVGR